MFSVTQLSPTKTRFTTSCALPRVITQIKNNKIKYFICFFKQQKKHLYVSDKKGVFKFICK